MVRGQCYTGLGVNLPVAVPLCGILVSVGPSTKIPRVGARSSEGLQMRFDQVASASKLKDKDPHPPDGADEPLAQAFLRGLGATLDGFQRGKVPLTCRCRITSFGTSVFGLMNACQATANQDAARVLQGSWVRLSLCNGEPA